MRKHLSPVRYAYDHLDYLYQFRRLTPGNDFNRENIGYLKSVLLDNTIYMPVAAQFNDPWEANPRFRFSGRSRNKDRDLAKFLADLAPEAATDLGMQKLEAAIRSHGTDTLNELMQQVLTQHLAFTPMLCLCEDPANQLLWSYYADGHSGYALVFDAKVLPFAAAVRVRYSRQYPAIAIKTATRIGLAATALAQKAMHWRHEKEWRLILSKNPAEEFDVFSPSEDHDENPGLYLRFEPTSLVGLIVGCRMQSDDLSRIEDIVRARSHPISILRAGQHLDRYSIDVPSH